MSIASGPIKRPVLTFVLYLIVIIIGIVSLTRLSIDLMPEVTNPTISVVTSYSNVGPQEIEELITRPVEEAVAAVQGVQEITSTSSEGRSTVRLAFDWGTNLDEATNDVRDRIDRILGRLPDDVERPAIRKFDLSAFPILIMGVSGNMSAIDLRQFLDDQVKYRLERIPGVAAIDISGGLTREIHVDLKSNQMKALGLSPDAVLAALRNENRNIPAGLFERGNSEVLIRTLGEYSSISEIEQTVITLRNGVPIQIRDVADVQDSWEEVRQLIRIDGDPGLRVSISKQSGANTVSVSEEVKKEIERINLDFPQIRITPLIDTSKYIRQSINNVGYSIILGGLLALLVLFLFLRNISSTAIIATAIPVSIIATFGLLYFGGFTLNIMTFGGLALGIGMLVDSSIVVLENIYRHREQGGNPIQSALVGTSEVWSAILASTLSTIVVFIPVVFIRGMSGIMFQQMAYVVSFSLLCSLIVALTLVPMLASRFLHVGSAEKLNNHGLIKRIYSASERIFKRIDSVYSRILDWALNHKKTVIISVFTLFLIFAFFIRFIGVELMPSSDEGEIRVNLEMAVGTRMEIVDKITNDVEEIVRREVPEMVSMIASIGGGGWRSSAGNTSQIRVMLPPKAERKRSSEQVANDVRKAIGNIPGVTIRTRAWSGLFILRMGSSSGDNIIVEIRGYDLETAYELAERVQKIIREVPGITDTQLGSEAGNPEQVIRIDRQKAADLGLSVARIGEALQTAIGGSVASYFREGGKQYRIRVRLSEEDRKNLDDLLDLTVVNNRGEPVILRNVVSTFSQDGPGLIDRKDQERLVTVSANFTGRDMGSVMSDIRQRLAEVPVPKDFAITFGGDYEEQQKAFRELIFGFILAVLLIYLVMSGQFESFRDPFVVLFSIPMALIGVVITMILTGTIFSMQAFMGCIMLAGIVVNNAILLVDYTNQLRRKEGMELIEAIKLSGARRLRPILMTTFTTALGLLPLSLGLGEGGETQAPLARVVIGGLISSSLITLILIPVVYSIFERKMKQTQPIESIEVE